MRKKTALRKFSFRRGQILIPSLLIIPSLLLFVYLIFDTARISREKIRQQFAVDSAAFIQMGDYTNLFNRTAYVNGAFPYRIFKETYNCAPGCTQGAAFGQPGNCKQLSDDTGAKCLYDALFEMGVIPRYEGDNPSSPEATPLDNQPTWKIRFKARDEQTGNDIRPDINAPRPDLAQSEPIRDERPDTPPYQDKTTLVLANGLQATKMTTTWEEMIGIYKFYSQVYELLRQVEDSQMTVFERLTENSSFFRKSYYLNANTSECAQRPLSCGDEGISTSFGLPANRFERGDCGNKSMSLCYMKAIVFHAKYPAGPPGSPCVGSFNVLYCPRKTEPIDMTKSPPMPTTKGLFQLAVFDEGQLSGIGRGYDVYQGYNVNRDDGTPANFFGVDFNVMADATCSETRGRPCVHARVASQCSGGMNNNCVWPDPTPKYQTRLYP